MSPPHDGAPRLGTEGRGAVKRTIETDSHSSGSAQSAPAPHADIVANLIARGLDLIELHGTGPDGTCHCPRGKRCESPGKHPKRSAWQNLDGLTAEQAANKPVGIITGRSLPDGRVLAVVDLDGPEAQEKWLAPGGTLDGFTIDTAREDGLHAYRGLPPGSVVGNSTGKLAKGIDIRAVGGFVVGPGTTLHKYKDKATGVVEDRTYAIRSDGPILDAEPFLTDFLTKKPAKAATTTHAAEPSTPVDLTDAERERAERYFASAIRDEVARLDAMASAATKDGIGYDGEPWNQTLYDVSCNVLEVANAPESDFSTQEAVDLLLGHAPRDGGFGPDEHRRGIESAQAKVGTTARKVPAPPATFPAQRAQALAGSSGEAVVPTSDDTPKSDEKMTHAQTAVEVAQELYDFRMTTAGEIFAIPKDGPPLALLLGEQGRPLHRRIASKIHKRTGGTVVGSEALNNGIRVVMGDAQEACETDRTDLHLRVARDGADLVLDLGQPGNAKCVVISAGSWAIHEQPPAGIYFRRPSSLKALPDPDPTGEPGQLRELLGFPAGDPRGHLARGWCAAALRPEIDRPLILAIGQSGSGKSTRGLMLANSIDPRGELGSSFGRNVDDDQVKALSRYVVGYDNLTSISGPVSDHICRLVTGDEAEKRQNYSDTGVITMSYKRTGVLTSVNMPALRSDALERVIPLFIEVMPPGERIADGEIEARYDEVHPQVLGAVLNDASTMLANLPKVKDRVDGPRMLGYWQSLLAIDPALADAYAESARDILVTAAEEDAFVQTIKGLIEKHGTVTGTPTEVYQKATAYMGSLSFEDQPSQWPPKPHAFSRWLGSEAKPLGAVGIVFTTTRSHGKRLWTLGPAGGEQS